MPSGPDILLTLKVLVCAVTVLFAAAVWAIATGRKKLHGRSNTAFFALTLSTVVGFELLLKFGVEVSTAFTDEERRALGVHLWFAVPSAVLKWKRMHVACGLLFTLLWAGTFVTGVFFLPHAR